MCTRLPNSNMDPHSNTEMAHTPAITMYHNPALPRGSPPRSAFRVPRSALRPQTQRWHKLQSSPCTTPSSAATEHAASAERAAVAEQLLLLLLLLLLGCAICLSHAFIHRCRRATSTARLSLPLLLSMSRRGA